MDRGRTVTLPTAQPRALLLPAWPSPYPSRRGRKTAPSTTATSSRREAWAPRAARATTAALPQPGCPGRTAAGRLRAEKEGKEPGGPRLERKALPATPSAPPGPLGPRGRPAAQGPTGPLRTGPSCSARHLSALPRRSPPLPGGRGMDRAARTSPAPRTHRRRPPSSPRPPPLARSFARPPSALTRRAVQGALPALGLRPSESGQGPSPGRTVPAEEMTRPGRPLPGPSSFGS